MEPNTFMRDKTVNHKGANYDAKARYQQYSKEFKKEAVALITKQDYTVAKAAEAFGIATNMLYRWKDNTEKQKTGINLSEDARTEIKGLRQEVKTLRVRRSYQ
jgi:transposase